MLGRSGEAALGELGEEDTGRIWMEAKAGKPGLERRTSSGAMGAKDMERKQQHKIGQKPLDYTDIPGD